MKVLHKLSIQHLILALLFTPIVVRGQNNATGSSKDREFIRRVAHDIAKLKKTYPQLRDFSPTKHTDMTNLKISYNYHTHRATHIGGWTAQVPNPDSDGVWFYLDLHDPDSTAQIHTQPASRNKNRVGNKSVAFLILEGTTTKSVVGEISAILRRHGVKSSGH